MEFRQQAPQGRPANDVEKKTAPVQTGPIPTTGREYRQKHSVILKNIDNPPEPFFAFDIPELPQVIYDTIMSNGFKAFTPVQAQGMPIIMSGRDFIGISKTGSGKTLAFLIPAIIHLLNHPNRDSRETSILVLSPTRELAMQIQNEFKKFLSKSRITWACVYGGIKKDYQRSSLLRGVQILVATPGRLIDFIQEDSISIENVGYFVLDEADRMLDMGFAPQIREILSNMKKSRQSLMFSATWPFEIKQLADRYLTNPVSLQIGVLERSINDSIKQDIKMVSYREKFKELLKDLQRTSERRLIFVQRKIDCERICQNLQNEGEKCVSIHGDKVQIHRDKALAQFKTGKIKILVATDVASRGLDIPDVELVINYDFPKQIEDYIHRIGRTGRAGKSGLTVAYLTEGQDNRLGLDLIKVLKESSQVIPNELYSFSQRKGGDNKYQKFNKNRYSYDINSTSSALDTWRTSKPTELKSMKSFEEPRMQQQTKNTFKSEKIINKPLKSLFRDKIYHPTLNFECNNVLITIKMNDILKANAECMIAPCLTTDKDHKHTTKMSKILGVNLFEQSRKAKLGTLRELEAKGKNKTISYALTFQLPENDTDGSFLTYILQKIIKETISKGYESICLHELGMNKYPAELEAKTILYTLLDILTKEEKLDRLNDIFILVEEEKEFVEYTKLYTRIIGEATQFNNVVIENDST